MSAPTTDPLIGRLLDDRYRIEAKIGAGGMGSVYRAVQINVERSVAVKVLAHAVSADPVIVARFRHEAQLISKLRHPNTLELYDVGSLDEGRLYFVTELLAGQPLNRALRDGPLELLRALGFMVQICGALEEAHAAGIVHRDLKPANIFIQQVGEQEFAKVLDFGIAKLSDQTRLTRAGEIFGTPAYMSPEQARGDEVDPRSDIYSLGIILYECLAGRTPFVAENTAALLLKHITEPPPHFSELSPPIDVPPAIADLVMQMLEKEPDDRPSTVGEVGSKLTRRPEPPEPSATAKAPEVKTRTLLIASGVALAIIVGGRSFIRPAEPARATVPVRVPEVARPPDAALEAQPIPSVRAFAIRGVAVGDNWSDAAEVRRAFDAFAKRLNRCVRAAAFRSPATFEVRVAADISITTGVTGPAADRFSACALPELRLIAWPSRRRPYEPGELRFDVGP
jgi:hypothetical protein